MHLRLRVYVQSWQCQPSGEKQFGGNMHKKVISEVKDIKTTRVVAYCSRGAHSLQLAKGSQKMALVDVPFIQPFAHLSIGSIFYFLIHL